MKQQRTQGAGPRLSWDLWAGAIVAVLPALPAVAMRFTDEVR